MDLLAIEDAIKELEHSETTFDNVQELANLYTVYNNFVKEPLNDEIKSSNDVVKEIVDIIPSYYQYCSIKREYQLHNISYDDFLPTFKALCAEIVDFLTLLYATTISHKERLILNDMINSIQKQYSK